MSTKAPLVTALQACRETTRAINEGYGYLPVYVTVEQVDGRKVEFPVTAVSFNPHDGMVYLTAKERK